MLIGVSIDGFPGHGPVMFAIISDFTITLKLTRETLPKIAAIFGRWLAMSMKKTTLYVGIANSLPC